MTGEPRSFDPPAPDAPPPAAAVMPRAFDPAEVEVVREDDLAADDFATPTEPLPANPRRARWGAILVGALGGLFSMVIALWATRLVESFFAVGPAWLGWLALALALLALVAFLALVGREVYGFVREKKIERLRAAAIESIAVNDTRAAARLLDEVMALYERDDASDAARRIRARDEEILDAADRLALAEREYLAPLDEDARQRVAAAAKRVSVVTAISPRALIDVAFVLWMLVRLLRQIAALYGGRPGLFGVVRLSRLAVAHLVLTTGVAVGDSITQDMLGAGLAARVSSRLGEGVLNGAMTARFGIALMAVCRPLPYIAEKAPKFRDVAKELVAKGKE
ncbi:MAG: TIGR01620 family protein [Azoarcus sp.]|jgi:putative membrane protein|nr:TIGR01620 family protein [Azoarcus sp.]